MAKRRKRRPHRSRRPRRRPTSKRGRRTEDGGRRTVSIRLVAVRIEHKREWPVATPFARTLQVASSPSVLRPPSSVLCPPSSVLRRATLPDSVGELVFFYGTLMAGFDRRRRAGIDDKLKYM